MYERHFGLRELPFNVTPDPRFLYVNECYQEAIAALGYGIEARKGFVTLVGEAGTGKTTLLRRVLDGLDARVRSVLLLHPTVRFDEILEHVLQELGIPTAGGGKLVLLQRLGEYLVEHTRAGGNAALLIDEAQDLAPEDPADRARGSAGAGHRPRRPRSAPASPARNAAGAPAAALGGRGRSLRPRPPRARGGSRSGAALHPRGARARGRGERRHSTRRQRALRCLPHDGVRRREPGGDGGRRRRGVGRLLRHGGAAAPAAACSTVARDAAASAGPRGHGRAAGRARARTYPRPAPPHSPRARPRRARARRGRCPRCPGPSP